MDLALPLFEQTLAAVKAKLGVDHPSTLLSMGNLASGYMAAGKPDLALPLFEETLKVRKAKLGADHPDTLTSMNNLAFGYEAVGKRDLALPLHEESLKLKKAKLGADHSETLTSMGNLGNGYRAAGKLDQALPLLEETLKLVRTKLGADHSYALTSMNNLALGYQDAGKLDLALPLFQEAVASIEKLRFQHLHAGLIVPNLIACHEQLKQFDQAETWRRKWLAVVKERSGADSAAYAVELALLGSNLLQLQKWTESESVLRECRDIREKIEPDSWTTFNTQSMLGAALQGQRKYAEAEPLLLAGYEGMKKPTKTIPASSAKRLLVALDRLIEVYTMLEKPDEVTKWQAERAKNLAEETTEKK